MKTKIQKTKKKFSEHYDLPIFYDITSLTILVRDPFWMHAYWTISASSLKKIKKQIGRKFSKAKRILRVYDVTSLDIEGENPKDYFDVEIPDDMNHKDIKLWRDHMTCCSQIGFKTVDGNFFSLMRSNIITTPRVAISSRQDLIYMDIRQGANKSVFVNTRKVEELEASTARKFLAQNEILEYYLNERSLVGKKRDGNLMCSQKTDLSTGTSEQMMLNQESLQASASEGFLGASESLKSAMPKNFFFEIRAELIVYGRTEPNAEVFLEGEKVDLRQDGTFTLRFALPDGNIPLDFVAIAKDRQQQRRISTAVKRKKTVLK